MRLSSLLIVLGTFTTAAMICIVAAVFSVALIEDSSESGVKSALDKEGLIWAEVYAEGLQVFIAGTAPTEALRFKAISTAGSVVDAARIIDNMQAAATVGLAPPRFSIEILRNDSGISLIGLIPTTSNRQDIVDALSRLVGRNRVTDLMETADYDTSPEWVSALDFALNALEDLPRSKISISSGRVAITAMTESGAARQRIEAELKRNTPQAVQLALDLSAPRPVITPFTLRFVKDATGARFDACSADTEQARNRILAAARALGLDGDVSCIIGLGVPSPNWAKAVQQSLSGLGKIGGGSVTIADADITLVAPEGTDQDVFDRIVGELQAALPEVFSLHSELPALAEEDGEGPPEFIATLSPEGLVQLRGRLKNRLTRETTVSYARARFGSDNTYMAARIDETLPGSWPVRVLASLDALSLLANGVITVTPERVDISGSTGDPQGSAEISRVLVEKLGETEKFSINVKYREQLNPVAAKPKPDDCEIEVRHILSDRKIQFDPGKSSMDKSAVAIMDDIAEILAQCGEMKFEIQGHTDSQGREEMNQQLSQARAQSVINELRDRRVLTSALTAKGYGESQPIASNDTQQGREANRRIAFVLIRPKPVVEEESTLDSIAMPLNHDQAAETASPPKEDTADDQN